jgi:hypothetical protein
MSAWWVTFKDGTSACIEAVDGPAAVVGATIAANKIVINHSRLPYPAEPRIGQRTSCQSYCYDPHYCKEHGACPKSPACTS